jgi:hypothetical protein
VPLPWHSTAKRFRKQRGGSPDNEFVSYPPSKVGGAGYAEFYETTLPADKMVPGPFNDVNTQRIFFDQSYKDSIGEESHPKDLGSNKNVPDVVAPTGNAEEGSGGNYLSNEIFYRTAYRRTKLGSSTLTGHFHIPGPQQSNMRIEDIIDEVRQLIARGLDP